MHFIERSQRDENSIPVSGTHFSTEMTLDDPESKITVNSV